ncbi:apolipoprotein A-I-like [Cheilinus undulatus]|uniref:apolipoprotein A-I-like n=1 Tax=Cheilinus undulatus TaxID=241271 RepID=UPI001BD33CF7|nr:apolipoprotein A-I-like [Cheilinus undulatus]
MKVLVVLALAVLTGCNANLLYADEPKPQLEALTDAFWDYVAKATKSADDTLQMIKSSQFGQDVTARLTDSADAATLYTQRVHEQLPPAAQEMISTVTMETYALKTRLEEEMATAKAKLDPITEDMKTKIQQQVEQLKQELAPLADMDPETLRATLIQKTDELKASLEASVLDLRAQLNPYSEDMRQKVDQHLQDFKERVVPVTERVHSEVTQRVQQARDMAIPYVEEIREKLDPLAKDVQDRLTALYESFTQTN